MIITNDGDLALRLPVEPGPLGLVVGRLPGRDQAARDVGKSHEKTAEHLALVGATDLLLTNLTRDISRLSVAEAAQLTEAVRSLELVAMHLLQRGQSK